MAKIEIDEILIEKTTPHTRHSLQILENKVLCDCSLGFL